MKHHDPIRSIMPESIIHTDTTMLDESITMPDEGIITYGLNGAMLQQKSDTDS